MGTAIAWTITSVVVVGCAFCLTLFGSQLDEARGELAQTREDLGAVKKWIAENFRGPEPLVLVDEPTPPIDVPTVPEMPAVEVVGGKRKPVPYKRGRHAA